MCENQIEEIERIEAKEAIDSYDCIVEFIGEAWLNDYAIQTDYTEKFTIPLRELHQKKTTFISSPGKSVNNSSWMVSGSGLIPDEFREYAPEKANEWSGPFSIYLRKVVSSEE